MLAGTIGFCQTNNNHDVYFRSRGDSRPGAGLVYSHTTQMGKTTARAGSKLNTTGHTGD